MIQLYAPHQHHLPEDETTEDDWDDIVDDVSLAVSIRLREQRTRLAEEARDD